MQLENWTLDRFIEYASNPRENDHAVDKTAAAIHEFGFRVPIVAKSDGLIVDGHLRLKAAKKLKLETVPVLLADDMSDAQIKAFRISVNKIADLADWNEELLSLEIEQLKELDFDIDLLGFDEDELADLLPEIEDLPDGDGDEDAVPELQDDPVSKLGDVWALGAYYQCSSCQKCYNYTEGLAIKECPCDV